MSYHHHSPWRPTLATIVITSITVTTTYFGYQLVSQYGLEGTFWYIWEGSPYPPQVRTEFETLQEVETSIAKEDQVLDRLEEAYQRALLESVDGSSEATIVEVWNATLPKQNLEKLIGRVSYNLDLFAAKVDAVPSKQTPALKARKKQLSNQIVKLMQRADIFVTFYQEGQKQQREAAAGAAAKSE